jgi:DNA-binding FadR family transcriptional regulator
MATQTKQQRTGERRADFAGERYHEIGERILESGRKTGGVYLDAYERTANTVADFHERLARSTENEWLASLVQAQADLTRDVARAQVSAGRELLR